MTGIINFFKQIRIRQLLGLVLAGALLLTTTACNTGDVRGARPQNPPVQLGGNNNPAKGGDGYTQYKATTDPKVKKQAALPADHLLAAIDSNASDLLYPGSNAKTSDHPAIGPSRDRDLKREVKELPQQPQYVFDRNDPDAKILERVGEAFEDASAFITDKAKEAGQRPEMQRNPALGK